MARIRTREVADGVHVVLGSGAMPNAAFVDGAGEGAVVVDSLYSPLYARELMSELRARTGADVLALVNTHHHPDHTFGNAAIPTDRIIAHSNARARLEELGDAFVDVIRERRPDLAAELEGVTLRLPTETFDDRLELRLAGMTLDLRHPGVTAHTAGDITIRIPERDTILVGDLVSNGVVPVIRDGDLQGQRQALVELRQAPLGTVVPGHGEVGGSELLTQQLEFIDDVLRITAEVLRNGGTVDEASAGAAHHFEDLLLAEQRIGDWVRQAAISGD
jgi:cyclase